MSRAKGNAAPDWIARHLARWWPGCEKTPNGRKGRDLQGTLGVAFEIKTGKQWRSDFILQAASYQAGDDVPVLIWLREGQGEKAVPRALSMLILPLDEMMIHLEESGWAPRPAPLRIVGD